MHISLLAVAHIVLAVLLIIVVLLQRSESNMGALGGSNAVFTGKSVSGILTKATAIIATLFMVVSLIMVKNSYDTKGETSVIEKAAQVEQAEKEVSLEDKVPAIPAVK